MLRLCLSTCQDEARDRVRPTTSRRHIIPPGLPVMAAPVTTLGTLAANRDLGGFPYQQFGRRPQGAYMVLRIDRQGPGACIGGNNPGLTRVIVHLVLCIGRLHFSWVDRLLRCKPVYSPSDSYLGPTRPSRRLLPSPRLRGGRAKK